MPVDQLIPLGIGALGCGVELYLLAVYGSRLRFNIKNLRLCVFTIVMSMVYEIAATTSYFAVDPLAIQIIALLLVNCSLLLNALFAHLTMLAADKKPALPKPLTIVLYIIPVVSILLSFFKSTSPLLVTRVSTAHFSLLDNIQLGIVLQYFQYASIAILIIAIVVSLSGALDHNVDRKSIVILAAAALFPLIVGFFEDYLASLLQANYGYAQLISFITIFIYCSVMFGYLRNARSLALQLIDEGYLVFDKHGFLTDINAFTEKIFPHAAIGLSHISDFAKRIGLESHEPHDIDGVQFAMQLHGKLRTYQLHSFKMSNGVLRYCGDGFIFHETTEFSERLSDMHIIATVDPLTGAKNRRGFNEAIPARIRYAADKHMPITILLFDIDHFKNVNDTYGHAVGDVALRHVAYTAADSLRDNDELFRYGGEEFVVFSLGAEASSGRAIAERLRKNISLSPLFISGHELKITISVGGASVIPAIEEGDNESELCDRIVALADNCAYRAKEGGRNKVVYYNDLPEAEQLQAATQEKVD